MANTSKPTPARSRIGLCLLALVGVLAALILFTGSARAAQVPTQYRGAQVHSLWATETTQQVNQDLDAVKATGANIVRLDVAWATLDSNGPGQLTAWYSQRLSQFMAYAKQLNIKVLPILFTTPCWASSAPDSLKQSCNGDWWDRGVGWYPPTNDSDFGAFVKYITSTYGSDLAAVEIWNEPDETTYWQSSSPAADYAQLLKAAYPAAKAGDSSIPVIAGAMSGADLDFLGQLYQDGIQGYYDGLSLHSYCDQNPPASTAAGNPRYEFEAGLEAMHAMQLQHGDNTPLWVTEFGWETLDTAPQNQAAYIQQAYQILAGMPYVQAGIVYELHDDIGGSAIDPGAHFGMMNADYSPKPAYAAFTAVMNPPTAPALSQPANGGAVNGPQPTVSFTAAPDSTIAVSIDGALAGTATANDAGTANFTISQPIADGPHTISGVDTDPYGNVGPASQAAQFIVHPGAPTLTTSLTGGTSTRPTFSFNAASGSKVAVYIDGASAGTAVANGSGVATLTAPNVLSPGQHSLYAVTTDTLGYTGPASATQTFDVAPPAPVVDSPRAGTTSGTTVSVAVTGVPGDVATVCVSGSKCATATVGGQGTTTVSMTGVRTGARTVSATQRDGAGITSPSSSSVGWKVAAASKSGSSPTATAASLGAPARLTITMAKLRSGALPVTCRVSTGTLTRCQVVLYVRGRKIGSGTIVLRRSGSRSALVRVHLNAYGKSAKPALKGRPTVTFKVSAKASNGRALTRVQRARLVLHR